MLKPSKDPYFIQGQLGSLIGSWNSFTLQEQGQSTESARLNHNQLFRDLRIPQTSQDSE